MSGSIATTDAGQDVERNAGASYDETFLPPTMTFALPADEKYAAPAWLAALAAFAIGPFWKNGSMKYETSSTMTSAWFVLRSAVIWLAKSRSPLNAVANARCAVMHDLRHRTALVGLAASCEVGLHGHRRRTTARVAGARKVTGCDVV